jgi:hypothetical protein
MPVAAVEALAVLLDLVEPEALGVAVREMFLTMKATLLVLPIRAEVVVAVLTSLRSAE